MNTIFITIVAFALMMLAMAIGVMVGRKPLKGSCGGVGGDCACEKAGTPGACAVPEGSAPGQTLQLRLPAAKKSSPS